MPSGSSEQGSGTSAVRAGRTTAHGVFPAVRTLLLSAGYDDGCIDRAFVALTGEEEIGGGTVELMSAREVCDWLRISLSTLWRWRVPHVRVGGLRRFYRTDVQRYLDRRYVRRDS